MSLLVNSISARTTICFYQSPRRCSPRAVRRGLRGANQSPVTRTFVYDSLKRLIASTNPENWTTGAPPALGCAGGTYASCYYYDADGNLPSKIDNRGRQITYQYDPLNRLTHKLYNNQTAIAYTYDSSGAYSRGRLSSVSTLTGDTSTTNYSAYDALGRVTKSSQSTAGTTYSFNYGYNLTDALVSETYPSGRVVNTCYNGANRESQVGGNCAAPGLPAYMTGAQYAAHGELSQYQYGNGVQRNVAFNGRLQPLTLTGQLNTQTLFNLSLSWGTTNNNGNLQGATYAGGGLTFADTFTYDGVNRLQTANDSGGWSRTFTYDAFGNMTAAGSPGVTSLSFKGNNQIVGKSYDQAGNQLTVNGNTVAYDFENHIVNETDGASQAVETYVYDGDGRRVEKYGPGGTPRTVFVYDAVGRLAAEYNSTATVGPPCVTCFLSDDHLGTPRLITDFNGLVAARHDYLPFGEEVAAGTFGRDQTYGPGADGINQKFTGKERDSESGLDYFESRYFGSALGRYTSPDEPFADQRSIDPQSWNLYTYARNNPLKYVDSTGKAIELAGDDDQRKKQLEALQNAVGKKAGSYLYDNAEKDKDGNATGRHFVGILDGGPSGKGPDFGSINAAASDIAGVVANTQIAQIHLMDAGQGFIYNGGTAATSLNADTTGLTSPFNSPSPIQIWLLDPSSAQYNDLPGYAMSNGLAGKRTLPDNEMHELGHAAWQMDIKGGRQVNPQDPYGNNRALKFENDTRRLRGGAERTEH